jgi:hypothetical protein
MTALLGSPLLPHQPAAVLAARYLPLHAAVFGTVAAIAYADGFKALFAAALWVSGFAAVFHRAARLASFFLCAFAAALLFPAIPNHGYVLCVALFVGAIYDTEHPGERLAMSDGFRYLGAIVLFWSGVQKLLGGTWTQGQLLAYEIGHSSRFSGLFGWLVTRSERHAFRTNGPFLASGPLVVVSNLVWVLEIAVGLGLLSGHARRRKTAAVVALIVLVGIEVVAREGVFGILMAALLLSAADARLRARWLWFVVPIELLAIGGRLSLVPGGFH